MNIVQKAIKQGIMEKLAEYGLDARMADDFYSSVLNVNEELAKIEEYSKNIRKS